MTTTTDLRVFRDTYVDSVVQLSATRAMRQVPGVEWAAAAMATPANLGTLGSEGFGAGGLGSANDLFLAVRGEDDEAVAAAFSAGEDAMFAAAPREPGAAEPRAARTIGRAVRDHSDTNVAVISVPGDYASLETHEALTAGLDVLLFSDNVPVADETALKDRAIRLGRFVMGPGAGTAMLGGTGLGFANVVRPGRVGIVAAAGTGAQEAMSLLDRFGVGVSCVIGLGGRDLSEAVDGRMAKAAIVALQADPGTDLIFLVSKPPAERVARAVVDLVQYTPFVASLVGLPTGFDRSRVPATARLARTLEAGVLEVLGLLGADRPDVVGDLPSRVAAACESLGPERTLVRGLFSGGTLCFESLVILSDIVGPVYSNVPLEESLSVPAPAGSHVCLDLGEEEYTKGRPHPMIDPEARIELLREQGRDPSVAAILLDVVLGHGSHDDPAGELAPVCAEVIADGGPAVVAYVLGTEGDPQGYARQRATMEEAGCIVTATATRAALAAAALAVRNPDLVTSFP